MALRPAGATSCDSRVSEDSYERLLGWALSVLQVVEHIFRRLRGYIMTCLLAPQANYGFETGGSHLL